MTSACKRWRSSKCHGSITATVYSGRGAHRLLSYIYTSRLATSTYTSKLSHHRLRWGKWKRHRRWFTYRSCGSRCIVVSFRPSRLLSSSSSIAHWFPGNSRLSNLFLLLNELVYPVIFCGTSEFVCKFRLD